MSSVSDGSAPISIGNHVWIGMNVVVMRGVTIGDNTIIGANEYPVECDSGRKSY